MLIKRNNVIVNLNNVTSIIKDETKNQLLFFHQGLDSEGDFDRTILSFSSTEMLINAFQTIIDQREAGKNVVWLDEEELI